LVLSSGPTDVSRAGRLAARSLISTQFLADQLIAFYITASVTEW